MPLTVQASEARAQFPKIARKVHDEGVEVTVIRGSRPYVKIVPLDSAPLNEDELQSAEDAAYLASYYAAAEEYNEMFEELSR